MTPSMNPLVRETSRDEWARHKARKEEQERELQRNREKEKDRGQRERERNRTDRERDREERQRTELAAYKARQDEAVRLQQQQQQAQASASSVGAGTSANAAQQNMFAPQTSMPNLNIFDFFQSDPQLFNMPVMDQGYVPQQQQGPGGPVGKASAAAAATVSYGNDFGQMDGQIPSVNEALQMWSTAPTSFE